MDLAQDVRRQLAELPAEAWHVAETKDQPRAKGAGLIPMRYHRLHLGVEALKARVAEAMAGPLAPRAHEQIFVNFSKYEEGDFLGSHTDTPSGSPSYERREAFVWHLSKGWEPGDGGLFVDEEAHGGPRNIVPSFNALVTFPVPRRHAVTRVTAKAGVRARFAAYGWVVVPCLARLTSPAELAATVQSTRRKAQAVLYVREPLQPAIEAVVALFAKLPSEQVGRHTLGELCAFAVTASRATAHVLGIPEGAVAAVAVQTAPAAVEAGARELLSGHSSVPLPNGCEVCADLSLLKDAVGLRRFIDRARFHPCAELDFQDSLLMADMFFSKELKVFIFIALVDRCTALMSGLSSWAAVLRPRIRIYLADPCLNQPIMEDFGLTVRDAPTAVADDTIGSLGRFRLKDHDVASAERSDFDLDTLRRWLQTLAKACGAPSPQLE